MPPRKKETPVAVKVPRSDGWANALTGIGTASRDKRMSNDFCVDDRAYSREFQEKLWEGDDMFARIVEMVPDEMMRNGFNLSISDAKPDDDKRDLEVNDAFGASPAALAPPVKPPGVIDPDDQTSKKISADVMARFDELGIAEKLLLGLCYERAYGGGGILLGVDDGQTPDKPLRLDKIKSFKWVNCLTPRELVAVRYYNNPYAEKYGEPELFRIQVNSDIDSVVSNTNKRKYVAPYAIVHESRLIIFPGVVVSEYQRKRQNGWGNSVLTRVLQVISDFQGAYSGAANLTVDFAQAVFKIKGLAEMMAGGDDEVVRNRALAIDMSRSLAKAILIDSEEEFERKPTPLSGLSDMLERFEHRLAAAADMPVTLLMGSSPSGLNSSGDSDIRFFYDRIKARQKKFLLPHLKRIVRIIMLAADGPTKGVEPDDWAIEFCSLWQLSDTEKTTNRKTQADADVAYINAGVLTPEEVAASRFGGTEYSIETTIDLETRKQMAQDHEAAIDAHTETMAQVLTSPKPASAPAKK